MPLPSGGAWPPPACADIQSQLTTWRAWYTGDPVSLTKAYTRPRVHASQYRGGVMGAVARFFWGQPTPTGERAAKSHVPVAADLASLSADLLFSDPPSLDVQADSTRARLDEYVTAGNLWSSMREAAEVAAAMGGVYLRVVWDATIAPMPWLAPVDPDYAVPEWTWDRLKAVTFWQVVERSGSTVTRLLERHDAGFISYGLYVGDEQNLGRRVALTDHEATAGLAAVLTDQDTVVTGYTKLTAVYVPNMRPNRLWRTPEGRSDFAGIEPLMDELDEVMSSWLRDIRLAKARLIVPESAVTSLGRGQGATFDTERELMLPLMGDPASMTTTLVQPAIRFNEHQESARFRVEQIVRGAGYSMQTFAPNGDSAAVTATEVAARERRSLTTRGRKISYWMPALTDALEALLGVDVAQFGADVVVERPAIEFPDAVSPDPKDVAQTLQLLHNAEAASTETKVRMLHPEWDDQAVADEVRRLTEAAPSAAPAAFGQDAPEDVPAEAGR